MIELPQGLVLSVNLLDKHRKELKKSEGYISPFALVCLVFLAFQSKHSIRYLELRISRIAVR